MDQEKYFQEIKKLFEPFIDDENQDPNKMEEENQTQQE